MAVKSTLSSPKFRKPRKKSPFNNTFVYDLNCRFRSKLEWYVAKWLNKYNIKWEFEPRVILDASHCYPDFWLPEYNTFLEMRPLKRIDEKLLHKVSRLKTIYQKEVVIATDVESAKFFLQRLDENREMSKPNKVWIFTGKRGELREIISHAVTNVE